jgi:hypothetical protein
MGRLMARRRRFLPVGIPAHIIHRGVNRQICFAADEDIAAYVNWLKEFARRYGVLIHGSEIPMSTARYSCNANNKDQPSERSPRKTNSPQVIGKKRFLIGQSLISQIPAHDSLSMKNSG